MPKSFENDPPFTLERNETQTTHTCSHYIKLKRNAPTSRVEPKRSKHAATIKIHRAERRQSFQKILPLDKRTFLAYASTNHHHGSGDSRNTIKGGTTQTTPVDPQQQASTHSSRPVNVQLLTSHHYTTRTWKINQPDEPATHCRIQRPSEHS
ncbi:uncharacterized protein LOC143917224 [Arctopsyche grandis]|uniref:uncharacterized protein LOC143917224 n=1 Tax=Arctopsyche grandis TaxID=121162 RepID=UPI00406D6734